MSNRPEKRDWGAIKRFLCIRLDSMGDVLMTSPAIRAIKESASGRKVTLLTSPSGAKAAELIPEIDDVIVYEAPWMKSTPHRSNSEYDLQIIDQIRKGHFDAAIIFTVFTQSPFPAMQLAYLADIPIRISYSRENPYQMLTQWEPETEPNGQIRHEVRRHLDLVASVGSYTTDERIRVRVNPEDVKAIRQELLTFGIQPGDPFVVIHPGATAESRRYPPEGYAAAARILRQKSQLPLIFTGSLDEVGLVEGIRALDPEGIYSLAGRLTISQLTALLSETSLLISNNTGPVHLAAGVGTPVVVLYALTNPQHTPWAVASRVLFHDVPCKFCYKSICPQGHHNCLRMVTPGEVAEAAQNLLLEISETNDRQVETFYES